MQCVDIYFQKRIGNVQLISKFVISNHDIVYRIPRKILIKRSEFT